MQRGREGASPDPDCSCLSSHLLPFGGREHMGSSTCFQRARTGGLLFYSNLCGLSSVAAELEDNDDDNDI